MTNICLKPLTSKSELVIFWLHICAIYGHDIRHYANHKIKDMYIFYVCKKINIGLYNTTDPTTTLLLTRRTTDLRGATGE